MARPFIGHANTFPPLTCERLEDRSLLSVSGAWIAPELLVAPCDNGSDEAILSDEGSGAVLPGEDELWVSEEEYYDDAWYDDTGLTEVEYWDESWVSEEEYYDESWYDDAGSTEEEYWDESWVSEEEYYDDAWYDDAGLTEVEYWDESWVSEEEYYDESWYDDTGLTEEEYYDETWSDDDNWVPDESWTREVIFVDDSWEPGSDWIWQCGSPTFGETPGATGFPGETGDEPILFAAGGIPVQEPIGIAETAGPIEMTADPIAVEAVAEEVVAAGPNQLPPDTRSHRAVAPPEVVAAVEGEEEVPAAPAVASEQPAMSAAGSAISASAASDDHLAGSESLELSEDLPVG